MLPNIYLRYSVCSFNTYDSIKGKHVDLHYMKLEEHKCDLAKKQ